MHVSLLSKYNGRYGTLNSYDMVLSFKYESEFELKYFEYTKTNSSIDNKFTKELKNTNITITNSLDKRKMETDTKESISQVNCETDTMNICEPYYDD